MACEIGDRKKIISRLDNTLCLYKNFPVHVSCRDLHDDCSVSILKTGYEKRVVVSYLEDDFSYVEKLGYINYRGKACFLRRIPYRNWKQGLCSNNVRISDYEKCSMTILHSKSFLDMHRNRYPPLVTSLLDLESEKRFSVALSRNFAIDPNHIYYRGKHVGIVVNKAPSDFTVSLLPNENYSTLSFMIRKELKNAISIN